MGCKSPVGVPLWTHRERRITTSRRQGQGREDLSGGSPSARGARRRTETAYKAEGSEASWHMTAKPTGTQPTVNAALVHRQFASLTWGDLRRVRCALMVNDPASDHTGIPRSRRRGELPAVSDESAAITVEARSATGGNAGRDGAEVSRRRSRWPGVGPLKGRTTRHKEQTLPTSNASTKPERARCARRPARTEP